MRPEIFARRLSWLLAAAVVTTVPTIGVAAGEEATLDEVVVTAQKREESLQDVPLSVEAVSGDKLADSGILRMDDLKAYVPNLQMTETGIANNIYIRGIGSGLNQGFEQSVSMYADGIYRGRGHQSRMPFLDLARIEVLRGPQPTLFSLWPMNWPTPYPLTTSIAFGGSAPSQLNLPRVAVHGTAPPPFAAPQPIEKPAAIMSIGAGAWPGSWTVLRDEVNQRSTVTWQGTAAVAYPWGRFDHSERLIYEIDDAHPELASVQGDSEYIQAVKDHVLTWRGRLTVSSDAHTFFYKYTRTLLKDGALVKTKTWEEPIPRDHQ